MSNGTDTGINTEIHNEINGILETALLEYNTGNLEDKEVGLVN